jgi:hypothetical protein
MERDTRELPTEVQGNTSPSAAPVPKVWAATAGSGFGGALGAVLVWGLHQAGVTIPGEIGIALSAICSTIIAFVAGYLAPPRST